MKNSIWLDKVPNAMVLIYAIGLGTTNEFSKFYEFCQFFERHSFRNFPSINTTMDFSLVHQNCFKMFLPEVF